MYVCMHVPPNDTRGPPTFHLAHFRPLSLFCPRGRIIAKFRRSPAQSAGDIPIRKSPRIAAQIVERALIDCGQRSPSLIPSTSGNDRRRRQEFHQRASGSSNEPYISAKSPSINSTSLPRPLSSFSRVPFNTRSCLTESAVRAYVRFKYTIFRHAWRAFAPRRGDGDGRDEEMNADEQSATRLDNRIRPVVTTVTVIDVKCHRHIPRRIRRADVSPSAAALDGPSLGRLTFGRQRLDLHLQRK